MKIVRSLVVSSATLVLALGLAGSSSALAHSSGGHGSDDKATSSSATASASSDDSSSSSSSNSRESGKSSKVEAETEVHHSNEVTGVSTTADDSGHTELHARGAVLLKEMETHHKVLKTDAQRQKVCENRKDSLTGRISGLRTNSQNVQSRIDAIYSKAQAYQQKNNLQPANYANLIAAADMAKAQSTASIAALQAVTPTVNCEQTTTTSDVATYKAAAATARDDLKNYRTAVKAVLRALIDTKVSNSGSTN